MLGMAFAWAHAMLLVILTDGKFTLYALVYKSKAAMNKQNNLNIGNRSVGIFFHEWIQFSGNILFIQSFAFCIFKIFIVSIPPFLFCFKQEGKLTIKKSSTSLAQNQTKHFKKNDIVKQQHLLCAPFRAFCRLPHAYGRPCMRAAAFQAAAGCAHSRTIYLPPQAHFPVSTAGSDVSGKSTVNMKKNKLNMNAHLKTSKMRYIILDIIKRRLNLHQKEP